MASVNNALLAAIVMALSKQLIYEPALQLVDALMRPVISTPVSVSSLNTLRPVIGKRICPGEERARRGGRHGGG